MNFHILSTPALLCYFVIINNQSELTHETSIMNRIAIRVLHYTPKCTSNQIPNLEIGQRIIMISSWWDISNWTQTLRKRTEMTQLKENVKPHTTAQCKGVFSCGAKSKSCLKYRDLQIFNIPLQSPSSAEKINKEPKISNWGNSAYDDIASLHISVEKFSPFVIRNVHELLQWRHDGVRLCEISIIILYTSPLGFLFCTSKTFGQVFLKQDSDIIYNTRAGVYHLNSQILVCYAITVFN